MELKYAYVMTNNEPTPDSVNHQPTQPIITPARGERLTAAMTTLMGAAPVVPLTPPPNSSGVPTVATKPPPTKALVPSSVRSPGTGKTTSTSKGTKATTAVAKPKVMLARNPSKSTRVSSVPLSELGTELLPTGYTPEDADIFHPRFREIEFLARNPESVVEEGQIWVHFNNDKKRELVMVNEVTPKGEVHLTVVFLSRSYSGKRVGKNFTGSISDFYKEKSNYSPYGVVIGASS